MRAIEPQHSDVIAEETSPFRRCVSAAVQVSMTIGHAPLTLVGLDTEGFTIEANAPFTSEVIVYFTFSVSKCLSVTIPARLRTQRDADSSTKRRPRFVADFDFVDDGSDRTEVLGMLVHTATTADLVH